MLCIKVLYIGASSPKFVMHYAVPRFLHNLPYTVTVQGFWYALWRFMHYHLMHYHLFDCKCTRFRFNLLCLSHAVPGIFTKGCDVAWCGGRPLRTAAQSCPVLKASRASHGENMRVKSWAHTVRVISPAVPIEDEKGEHRSYGNQHRHTLLHLIVQQLISKFSTIELGLLYTS